MPQRAVTEIQGKYMVAVVGADNKADMRPVKTGERVDSLWVILEGLNPGERVVAAGIQKVRPGMPVTPEEKPEAQAETKPKEKPGENPQTPSKPAEPAKAERR